MVPKNSKKLKILVTGGAGFLGINLIRYLLKKDFEVVSLDIVDFVYEDVKSKITIFQGDICDPKTVDQALEAVDVIVHCAAALPLYTAKEIYRVNFLGTKSMLEGAKRNYVKRVIYISSSAVYGIPDHHPLFEDDELIGVGPYGETKILAEKEVIKYRNHGVSTTILRPKSFIGPERLGVFGILFDWVIEGKNIPIVGSGKNRYQLLDVDDLSESIVRCILLPKEKVNNTFNIGAKEFTTMAEDFGVVLAYAGYGKRIIPIPAKPLIWLLRILEKAKLSPLYRWVYETAPEDSFIDISRAEEILDFTPKYSNKDALIKTYKWYEKNYEKYNEATGITHRIPWKQGILKVAKIFF